MENKGKCLKTTLESLFKMSINTSIDFTQNLIIAITKSEMDIEFYKKKLQQIMKQLIEQSNKEHKLKQNPDT